MRKIRIAQIGMHVNSHSIQVFQELHRLNDVFELVGCHVPEEERTATKPNAALMHEYPQLTLEEILHDPTIEAVVIETDVVNTVKYAIMAAEHGKHIHMEKPGGRELPDFEKLVSLVKAKNLVFHTGYMYRYNPCVRRLFESVRNGDMGDIISVEAQMSCFHQPDLRRYLDQLPGGMMFYLGCHLIDLVLQLQGDPDNIIRLNRRTGAGGVDSSDFGMAVFEYPRGVSFVKTSAVERGGYLRRQLVVTGTKATVELKPFEFGSEIEMYTGETVVQSDVWADAGEHTVCGPYNRYTAMMAGFADMVRGDTVNPWTPDYELKLFRTMMYCCNA